MHILLIRLDHKRTPLEARERVSFSKKQPPQALSLLKEHVGEVGVLTTSNSTEIYSVTNDPVKAAVQIRRFMTDFYGLARDVPSMHMYDYVDADAVHHIFRVACGLDSIIIGESQILDQIRDALSSAIGSQSAHVSLASLLRAALRVGRRVREETNVEQNALSISYAVVQLAQRTLGSLRGLVVLLIGASEAGQLAAKALQTVGVTDLMIANYSLARSEVLAQHLGGRVIPYTDIQANLEDTNIVVVATDSLEFVITREMIGSAVHKERKGPLLLLDLAIPRDVESQVASLHNVRLFNIDDLFSIAEENVEERKRTDVDAEVIVRDELERFMQGWDSLEAAIVIETLRQMAEEIRKRELVRAFKKMSNLPSQHLEIVDTLTQSIVNKLLHNPTTTLKRRKNRPQLQAVRNLFRL